MIEYKKVKDITESQLRALEAQGWEYDGEVTRKGKDGKRVGTGYLRFKRERPEATDSDVVLSPKSIRQKARTR